LRNPYADGSRRAGLAGTPRAAADPAAKSFFAPDFLAICRQRRQCIAAARIGASRSQARRTS